MALILRINVDDRKASSEEIVDQPAAEFKMPWQDSETEFRSGIGRKAPIGLPVENLIISAEATFGPYKIFQYQNGTIVTEADGVRQAVTKPILRKIAIELAISLLDSAREKPKNTRQLGRMTSPHLTVERLDLGWFYLGRHY